MRYRPDPLEIAVLEDRYGSIDVEKIVRSTQFLQEFDDWADSHETSILRKGKRGLYEIGRNKDDDFELPL